MLKLKKDYMNHGDKPSLTSITLYYYVIYFFNESPY